MGSHIRPAGVHQLRMPTPFYRLAVAAVAVAAGMAAGSFLPWWAAGATDFVEYAAAARLLLAGDNPYDAAKLLPIQKAVGWTHADEAGVVRADMMWNPPWAFAVVLPTGLVPWGVGLGGWVAAQAAAAVAAALLAWRLYGGPPGWAWAVVVAVMVFPPVLLLLKVAQVSGFLLFGLAGFAAAVRAGRPALAGAAAALTALKPHLFVPFAVLLACDAFYSRPSRRTVGVGAAVLAVAAVFPLLWNADVWSQYLAAVRAPGDEFHYAPADWAPPTLSYRLRAALGADPRVQAVPSVAATVVMVGYWWMRRRDWDWPRELPLVVLVGVVTTGYGAWAFDLAVLALPAVQAAAWVAADPRPKAGFYAMTAYLAGVGLMLTFVVPVLWWGPLIAAGWGVAAYRQQTGRG